MRRLHPAAAAWALLGCVCGATLAADQGSDPSPAEGRALIAKIRREMRTIDEALLTARDPASASQILEQSIRDLNDLLHSVEGRQSQVIDHLDALAKLAKSQQSQGGT